MRLAKLPRIRGAIRTQVLGFWFDSRKEARRYQELHLMQLAGHIHSLEVHPKYYIIINGEELAYYEGDFCYTERASGKRICEDTKGYRTDIYILKIKIIRALYPSTEFREVDAYPKRAKSKARRQAG